MKEVPYFRKYHHSKIYREKQEMNKEVSFKWRFVLAKVK